VKKKFENRLRINRVTAVSLVSPFFEHSILPKINMTQISRVIDEVIYLIYTIGPISGYINQRNQFR